MADSDVLMIGAGHNALVCAGYLAKAGYKVTVVERRHKIGGAVVTEEIVPGFKFDLGGSAHILINHTDGWDVSLNKELLTDVRPGQTFTVELTVQPTEDAILGTGEPMELDDLVAKILDRAHNAVSVLEAHARGA